MYVMKCLILAASLASLASAGCPFYNPWWKGQPTVEWTSIRRGAARARVEWGSAIQNEFCVDQYQVRVRDVSVEAFNLMFIEGKLKAGEILKGVVEEAGEDLDSKEYQKGVAELKDAVNELRSGLTNTTDYIQVRSASSTLFILL